MTRLEKAALARKLREEGSAGEGLSLAAVAREMGCSTSYVSALLLDPDGSKDRARKEKYKNSCPTCGTACHGTFCVAHAPRMQRTWTEDAIIEAIQEWDIEHGRPPTSLEWSANPDLPDWIPSTRTVYNVFGKNGWNKAIAAAGFEPRPAIAPEYVWRKPGQLPTPQSAEARQASAERGRAAYDSDPNHPLRIGQPIGQELLRRRYRNARVRRAA